MHKRDAILRLLADGKFHSGEAIAHRVGCSRSAVWKHIAAIREQTGLSVDAVTGKGYRVSGALQLLDEGEIKSHLSAHLDCLDACHVLGTVSSTNLLAREQGIAADKQAAAWLAEHQTAGRGRRGRDWVSPYGRNLYLSLAYRFDLPLPRISGLSLAAGAATAGLLSRLGVDQHGLKWPNDLLWRSRKLGGILLEAQGEAEGPAVAIIGVGLNLDLDPRVRERIDQPAVCLREIGLSIERNRLAGELIGVLLDMCEVFEEQGLQAFLPTWREYDLMQGHEVCLEGAGKQVSGSYRGVGEDGGLQIQVGGEVLLFHAGEISLRPGAVS